MDSLMVMVMREGEEKKKGMRKREEVEDEVSVRRVMLRQKSRRVRCGAPCNWPLLQITVIRVQVSCVVGQEEGTEEAPGLVTCLLAAAT